MATKKRGSRYFLVTTADHADFLEIGPPNTPSAVGGMMIQFSPSVDFAGSFMVFGRMFGTAAQTQNPSPLQIPYRRLNVGAAASDYGIVADPISAAGLIQVPANALTISLFVACTAGKCDVFVWDVLGATSI